MNAARTAADAYGGFRRGERDAEHIRDDRLFTRFGHVAVGKFCFALGKFFGKSCAARAAAAAAVCARKMG